jgi:cytochrome c5
MTALGWHGVAGGIVAIAAAVGTAVTWHSETVEPEPGRDRVAVAGEVTGADLFMAKGCAGCHQGPGTTAEWTGGAPDLSDAADWADQRLRGVSAEDYIRASIRDPGAFTSPEFRPGFQGPMDAMPYLTVSDDEVEALTDYLLQR